MGAVTRRDLARAMKEATGGTIEDNDYWIETFLDLLGTKVAKEGRVELRGFGSFKKSTIKAHTTVNPRAKRKRKIKVEKSYTVDFRASRLLKEQLRKNSESE